MPVLVRVPHEGPRSSERALSLVLSSSVQNGTRPKEANACQGKIYSKHAHIREGRPQKLTEKNMGKKALIAMSGGVDSSVTAYLMKQKGFDCTGIIMRLADDGEAGEANVNDARLVAEKLGMELIVLDCREEFREKVICPFVESYEAGLTPNPCVNCNIHMKFGKLFEYAESHGFDGLVTGHYARVARNMRSGFFQLMKAKDEAKDQSYFLYGLTQDQLSKVMFPLGDYTKEEIRSIAEENGFVNARKKDSQDICFIPDGDFAKYIEKFRGEKPAEGSFLNVNGEKMGTHKGALRYTIGQRKGLGLSVPAPVYVLSKDMKANTVTVGSEDLLFSDTMTVSGASWTMLYAPAMQFECDVKVRYRAVPAPASVVVYAGGTLHITFKEPQRAITKGQSAVLYAGNVVLGGGIIN